jgi:hypothetical protein
MVGLDGRPDVSHRRHGSARGPSGRRRGRPRKLDARKNRLRFTCNNEEMIKFRILSRINRNISISVMARDIVLDEVNALLSDCPRDQLIAMLKEYGLTDAQIESLLASI